MGLDATMLSFTHGLSDGLPDIVQVQCTMSSTGIHTYGRVVYDGPSCYGLRDFWGPWAFGAARAYSMDCGFWGHQAPLCG